MEFRKSSYSTQSGNCVEVGAADDAVLVRDTTDRDGCALTVTGDAWATFTAGLK